MAKWLDKYEQGGLVLKKKTKDNFSLKGNANDSKVSVGPGFVGAGYDTTGRHYSPAWGGQFQDGGGINKSQDDTLEKIYSKWAALKKLGKVTLKPDESFTREKTGVGDIEFFAPNTPQVTYSNGYVASHPGPGTYGILYNPTTNNEQNIRLDMLHGMPEADSHFRRLRNRFKKSVKNSDIYNDMNYWYDKDKEAGNAEDGKERWMDNYIDGQLRTLLFEGDRAKQNYSDEEAKELLDRPKIKKKFDKLNTYLQKGQFGASVPGAVGFTYARTQDPAPSNGKYAKKTLASAQNGQEMKYYQDGLDFKPKSISQNGDWLKKYATEPMRQDATTNVVPRKMTAKEKKEAETAGNVARKRSAEKAKEIVEERMKNRSSKGDLNTPGSWHTEDKARLFPSSVGGVGEMIDDYINPGTYVGVLADALGESVTARDPKAIATSLALAAGTGAIGVDPLGSTIKGVKSAKNLVKQSYKINPLAEKLVNPNMAYRIADEASYQDFLRSGKVRPKSLTPEFQNKTFTDLKELIADRTTSFPSFAKGEPAWGYLPKEGKGYIYATEQPVIRRGDINPVTGKQVGGRHWAYRPIDEQTGRVITELPADKVKVYGSEPHWLKGYQEVPNIHSEEITRGPINWWEEPGFAKRNPNYNPNLPPPNPFPKQTASDVPQEMMPYLTPKNPDPSIYQRKYAEGGIVDPMGQWAHPGEVTIIPSNDITMEGVDYPVLGISDTGDTKMMQPGKDYKFKGTKVTEYPKGGWLNKYK